MKKKICILGCHGFVGQALTKKLIKSYNVTHVPSKDCQFIFDFASPTHESFETNIDYNFNTIISRMAYLMRFCADNNIKYVYPSSALVYEPDRPFKAFKEITEKMQSLFPVQSLALRIFPIYGVGETRTAIYQWCKSIKSNQRPIIYGDGKQFRDFIYIDDVVDNIVKFSRTKTGIVDVGVGKPHTFNQIIKIINKVADTNLKPIYVKAPKNYSQGIYCQRPVSCKVSLEKGIFKVLESL